MILGVERIFSAVLLIIGGFYILESLNLGVFSDNKPGTGFFPLLGGLVLATLSLIQLLTALLTKKGSKGGTLLTREGVCNLLFILSCTVVYFLLMQLLGFLVPTFFYISLLLRWLGNYSWTKIFLISITSTVTLYLIFAILFEMSLPQGFLW